MYACAQMSTHTQSCQSSTVYFLLHQLKSHPVPAILYPLASQELPSLVVHLLGPLRFLSGCMKVIPCQKVCNPSLQGSIHGTGSRSARLVFTTGFSSNYNGKYQCAVKERETSSSTSVVRNFELTETKTTITPTAPPSCSANSSQVEFQLHILDTNCSSWSNSFKETTRKMFHQSIVSVLQILSNHTLSQNTIQIKDLPTCSTKAENGVVFRGIIETSSVTETETVFCTLAGWQRVNPSININNELLQVDSGYPLQPDSFSVSECVTETTSLLVPVIALSAISTVLLVLVVVLFTVCYITLCCKTQRIWQKNDLELSTRQ